MATPGQVEGGANVLPKFLKFFKNDVLCKMAVLVILTIWPRLPPNCHPRWSRPRLGSLISVAKLPWLNSRETGFFEWCKLDQNIIRAPAMQIVSTQNEGPPKQK